MAIQKKHGKGRLDKWYRLAKEKGYRARAAFKLIQLNRKYGFLEKSKVLLDLCAAPGSWCQVAAETMPAGSIILGVDLAPIKPIPKTITFQSDITTDKCRAIIRSHLKTWKADTVLHDGAPNVGIAWVQDAYSQAELVLQSLKLATEFLTPGGTFVTKVFRSDSYNPLLWVFQQLFDKVEATKPPSSRNVSAEIFVVCRGFKAPKRIDPQFLNSESVFKQVTAPKENHEVKVYNPEKKRRKREGYEEGDYTQFKELPVSDFIATVDPISVLGTVNKLHFRDTGSDTGDTTQQVLDRLEGTTPEIRECCNDLKVLGRKEFKKLLQWRIRAREVLGFSKAKTKEAEQEEEAEVVSLDPELQMQKDLEALKDASTARKKKERRRENERKRKEIVRLQMHMQTPMEIGIDHSTAGMGSGVFSLKTADSADAVGQLSKGRMPLPVVREKSPSPETDPSSDEAEDRLEAELDEDYERYLQRLEESSSKQRAKRARQEFEKDEWDGFDDGATQDLQEEPGSGSDSDSDDSTEYNALHSKRNKEGSLTQDAQNFFGQDLFQGIDGLDHLGESDSGIEMDDASPSKSENKEENMALDSPDELVGTEDKPAAHRAREGYESKQRPHGEISGDESTDEEMEDDVPATNAQGEEESGPQNIEIITAEAMELARQIASGKKKKSGLVDDGFNKLAFRDRDGLPQWFLDDEDKSSKYQKPITAAASAALKEKLRLLNARPIKKVREAKARKQMRAARRLEKLRKKSALLADEEGVSEKDKAANIMKTMSRAAKKKPERKTQLVVAKGVNRGVSGRPRGVKGRYKVVDARLKKDTRALKRLAKKKKR